MMILWQLAAVLSGSSVGLLGTYLIGFRMPFLAIAISHAAMAGGVFAYLLGWPPGPTALAVALAAGGGMAWLTTRHTRADLNTVTSILLSLTMGLAFLGIGLNKGDITPMLGLMWGSLLFVRPPDVWLMAGLGAALGLFIGLYRKELDALLFSRPITRASGIDDRQVLIGFLVLASALVTVNIQIVGGLMMYSLLTNPAAAAYELGGSLRIVRMFSVALGILSTVGGFWLSYALDLPTGACIVLVSSLLYAVAVLGGRWTTGQNR